MQLIHQVFNRQSVNPPCSTVQLWLSGVAAQHTVAQALPSAHVEAAGWKHMLAAACYVALFCQVPSLLRQQVACTWLTECHYADLSIHISFYMQCLQACLTFTTGTGMPVVSKLHGHFYDDPDPNGKQAGASNLGHDLLQVGNIVGGSNQGSSAPKEGVGSSGVHDGMLLALLDCGSREADVP